MVCPKCRGALAPVDDDGSRVHRCGSCGGFWMPRSVLVNLIRSAASAAGVAKKAIGLLEAAPEPTGHACPDCTETCLAALTMRSVKVERCPACAGVFLAQGGFEAITARFIRAQREWREAEADWAQFAEKLKLERALRSAKSSDSGYVFDFDG